MSFGKARRGGKAITDLEDFVHPEDYDSYEPDGDYQENIAYSVDARGAEQPENYSCETCDRDFYSKAHFDKHISEHRVCNLEGCTFTAHEKIIENHIRMQHSTGLYSKIKKVNTPEDIAKWIEERKKRFPTKENIEQRQKEQQERLKRGERINKKNDRFGKNKYRLSKVEAIKNRQNLKLVRNRKKPPPAKKPVSLINEKSDWNGNMFPFRGTSELYKEVMEEEKSEYEDDEWNAPASNTVIKLNNALGALMGAYMSDDEFDEVIPDCKEVKEVPKKPADVSMMENKSVIEESTIITTNEDGDEEAPTETKIEKQPMTSCSAVTRASNNHKPQNRKRKKITNRSKPNRKNSKNVPKQTDDFPYNTFKRRKVTLLEKLLENEIRHERNVLLQCVRYVVTNNFFMDK